jgi:hypothetical protein
VKKLKIPQPLMPLPTRKPLLSKINKKNLLLIKQLKRNQQLQTACAAVAYAIAKVKKTSHTHAADVSQLSAV